MKDFSNLVFCLVLAIAFGCGYRVAIDVPKPKPYPSHKPKQMIAGIAQKDLTLPPGYPMSGYSINGRISRGYWIRPKATALYLRDTAGTPFVFVTTDLWAITDGQKMAVLNCLRQDTATDFIGESELLLSATHTHHSSGAIEFDKAFTATSIGFGTDTSAFAFTILQIVSAIKDAVDSAEAATVSYLIDTISGIAKNRSDTAYFANNPAERKLYLQSDPETNKYYRKKDEFESAIDRRLTAITVRNSEGRIKGVIASYPMHPTATGDATEVYSADVFGLAAMKASSKIATLPGELSNPIVAFYNGAEGDVAPDYRFHQRFDAVRIADKLSEAILRASHSGRQFSLNGRITHRTTTIDIAAHQAPLDVFDTGCYGLQPPAIVRTSKNPIVGAAVFAGASDGRTSLSSFGISDGIRSKDRDPEQGHKMKAVDFLFDNVWSHIVPKRVRNIVKKLVKTSPKSCLPISIHQVGDVYFTGLPGEFTTMLGRRIRKSIAANLNPNDSLVSLVGLADAYISYVTTPCEYEEQYYEGASNFFGISTGPVFVEEYAGLAASNSIDSLKRQKGRKTIYEVGKVVKFGPKFLGKLQVWNAGEGLHNLMVSADGFKVSSREVPPISEAKEPIRIDSNEIIVFSFEDGVNPIDSTKFYPDISLRTMSKIPIPLPEHILTVDKYAPPRSRWTVRILNTASLPLDTPMQVIVTSLGGIELPPSGFFYRDRGLGIK